MLTVFVVIGCALFADATALVPRIFKGNDTLIESYPYQISLDYNGAYFCGGSIISKHYVLTAAHCSNLIPNIDKLYVRAGNSYPSKGGTLHKVVKLIGHEEFSYEHGPPLHDIAIIKVEQPFQYDDTCQPIKLFNVNEEVIPGSDAVVTGYGLVNETHAADQLQSAVLTIISKQACKNIFEDLPEKQICAVGVDGKDSCTGDSGGPIAVDDRLAGIVSWGGKCGDNSFPTVYTEVSHYHDWISEHVQFDEN